MSTLADECKEFYIKQKEISELKRNLINRLEPIADAYFGKGELFYEEGVREFHFGKDRIIVVRHYPSWMDIDDDEEGILMFEDLSADAIKLAIIARQKEDERIAEQKRLELEERKAQQKRLDDAQFAEEMRIYEKIKALLDKQSSGQ